MKKMENKLEFEHEKHSCFEKWRLTYYKAKKVPCSDKEKAMYGVDYKYEKAPEEYAIIIYRDILSDSKQEIYWMTSWANSYPLKGERIFSFSNDRNFFDSTSKLRSKTESNSSQNFDVNSM